MNRITLATQTLESNLRECVRRRSRQVRVPATVSRWADGTEVIAVPGTVWSNESLILSLSDDPVPSALQSMGCVGVLQVGYRSRLGAASGWILGAGSQMIEAQVLKLVGPGMFTIPLTPNCSARNHNPEGAERWSRTIGALGIDVWERLTGLRYAVVGVGRTGSFVAASLVRVGARNLVLIDPDVVEEHNLGEMEGVGPEDVGRLKVEAVASVLQRIDSKADVAKVQASITQLSGVSEAAEADVIFCCVDNDGARIATAAAAALFCRVLVDIASGVHGRGSLRIMGADVRLVLPGRCLLCFGGIRDESAAMRVLESADGEHYFQASRDWQRERAGSVASLNQCAAALGMRLLEDLVGERVAESVWVRLEFDASGRPSIVFPEAERPLGEGRCPLCGLSGFGFSGLEQVRALLAQQWLWRFGAGETA